VNVYLAGTRIRLDPQNALGKGGEADVYALGTDRALKVFKGPDHPDLKPFPEEQEAARRRLATHQKKLREFPAGLPARVIAPLELATDRAGKSVVGYSMRRVDGAEPLLRYSEPGWRKGGVSSQVVTAMLADLHRSLCSIHGSGVVIGDFNDLNVLVRGEEAWLIDADSFQYGPWLTEVFTERFVDPLLCDAAGARPLLSRPYGRESDWYAFTVMVMQSLLLVGPYGGVYRRPSGIFIIIAVTLTLPYRILGKHHKPRFHKMLANRLVWPVLLSMFRMPAQEQHRA